MLDGGPGHAIVCGEDPFAEFAHLFKNADLAVCNLECVLGRGGDIVHKSYTFRGPSAAIPLLKKHFSAVCVANNHSGDFGPESLANQCELFEKEQLPYFGGGRNRKAARQPLILERKGLRIALLGYNGFPPRSFEATDERAGVAWLIEEEMLADIAAARRDKKADLVIPFLHWGREMTVEPTNAQKELARKLIDAGASAVIGGHPHLTQTVDIYRGKPIIYSLGNFVFDYFPVDPPVFTGWAVQLEFDGQGGVDLETFVAEMDRTGIPRLLPSAK